MMPSRSMMTLSSQRLSVETLSASMSFTTQSNVNGLYGIRGEKVISLNIYSQDSIITPICSSFSVNSPFKMILKAVEKRGIIIETLPILDEVSLQSAHSTKTLCSKPLKHFFFLFSFCE